MPQSPARTARTRAEILDHAGRLFRLRGYAGTNIDDVMLAAGLTRGAFYAHFTSKDDLFTEAWYSSPSVFKGKDGRTKIVLTTPLGQSVRVIEQHPAHLAGALLDLDRVVSPLRSGLAAPQFRVRGRVYPLRGRSRDRSGRNAAR